MPRPLSLAAALALLGPSACAAQGECGGHCGAGTHCEADKCVANVEAEAEEPAADAEPAPGKKRRKGRRKRRGGEDGDDEGGDEGEHAGPPLRVDDSRVPKYNPNRTQEIPDGSERLSDRAVKQHMRSLEPAFNRCIEQAAMATDDTLAGTVSFTIGVEPTGKVWG